MKGIILKELYQNIYIPKNRMQLVIGYIVALISMLWIKNIYGFSFSLLVYIPLGLAPALIQPPSERDAISGYEKILLTMPIVRKDVIRAKYLLALFFNIFNIILLLAGLLIHVYAYHSFRLNQGIYIVILSLLFSFVSVAINYLIFIVLGSKRGMLVYYCILVGYVFLYYWKSKLSDIEKIIDSVASVNPITMLLIVLLISLLSLLVSYILSAKYYLKKAVN